MESGSATSFEKLHGRERLRGPRTEAIQRECRRLPRLHVYQDIVVLLDRTSTFPILVRWVTIGNLDRVTSRNGVLWDLPHFRCRVKLRSKHPKAALALSEARNLPAQTSAA